MTRDVIAALYAYGEWANQLVLEEAAKLPADVLLRRSSQGYQSIHDTFVHLASADRRWLARWRGQALPDQLGPADVPTLDAIRRAWASVVAERQRYLVGLADRDLDEIIRVVMGTETRELRRWEALVQCANHGTQHRSEIAAMLTDAGHSPGNLDFSRFCFSRSA